MKDTLLTLIFVMKIEFWLILVFSITLFPALRSKISRYWQGRIFLGLLTITAITFLAFVSLAYSNGMIKES